MNSIFDKNTADWFAGALGEPTPVQKEAWPAIAGGKNTLVSAPTGTGKTLSAFLVFIDRLSTLAREERLEEKLYLIYVSPLKSLAGDIRENLRRPLDGIEREEGQQEITVANWGYAPEGPPENGEASAPYSDYHAGIALPDADLTVGPGDREDS